MISSATRKQIILLSTWLCLEATLCAAGSADSIAASLGLTTSTVLPFPSQTMAASDAFSYIKESWNVQTTGSFGKANVGFVDDPTGGSSSDSPVFAATYPAGSYSHGTGGAQFYSTFDDGFEAMLVSYDLAFDSDFDWVKGGKLPGIRGGPVIQGCSGGREPTGDNCFSMRVMWRREGAGELYGYIPSQPNLCDVDGTICNSDAGFSFGRGKFAFTAGQWQNVAVYSKMNDPSESNGVIALYFNGEEVFSLTDVVFRTSDVITAGGMYFSTFFGGGDESWSTPNEVHSYYRDFVMYGGAGGSMNVGGNNTDIDTGSNTTTTTGNSNSTDTDTDIDHDTTGSGSKTTATESKSTTTDSGSGSESSGSKTTDADSTNTSTGNGGESKSGATRSCSRKKVRI